MAFNAKNLTYEPKEPAFLQRLKGGYGGTDLARQQGPLARPRKQGKLYEEDEDEPVYYNETDPHEPVSKVDYDALSNAPITEQEPTAREQAATSVKGSNEPGTSSMPAVEAVHEDAQSRQLMAGIGTSSRKRSAKVVGGDAHADEVQKPNQKSETARKQGPKKAKRPKLSFQGD